MEVGSDPGGGYLVGAVVSERINSTLADFVPMRSIARIEPVTEGDAFEEPWSDPGGFDTGWVGETEARPETDTQDLKMHRTPLHEIYANPKLTQKVL
ncbi:MAG: phage major capsid protein, partial [Proteobacteria bacterium]|nr:phage major capsid protein [Pseudomonadota bacterium]